MRVISTEKHTLLREALLAGKSSRAAAVEVGVSKKTADRHFGIIREAMREEPSIRDALAYVEAKVRPHPGRRSP